MTKLYLAMASCAWVVLMLIVWALFVPKGLPIDTYTMLTLTGPLFLALARPSRAALPVILPRA